MAELAHNVGALDGTNSPRSQIRSGDADLEGEENLLLLCHDCHKIIDNPDHVAFFPPEKLREIKEAHELRVEMATENGGLTRTAALRVGSVVRGSVALASQREVAETLLAANYLGLVETERSGDFTCRLQGDAGGRGFWEAGQQRIDDTMRLARQAIDSGDVEHLCVFAIAPIPLLVYLGWHLDDKTPTRIFQKHRDQFVGWSWAGQSEPVDFDVVLAEPDPEAADVVLICSVSSDVRVDRLPAGIRDAPQVRLQPAGEAPSPTLVSHEETLVRFAVQWRAATSAAEARYPNAGRWHLVASSPVSVSIEMGRSLMRDVQPPVTVYQRGLETYEPVLIVNG